MNLEMMETMVEMMEMMVEMKRRITTLEKRVEELEKGGNKETNSSTTDNKLDNIRKILRLYDQDENHAELVLLMSTKLYRCELDIMFDLIRILNEYDNPDTTIDLLKVKILNLRNVKDELIASGIIHLN